MSYVTDYVLLWLFIEVKPVNRVPRCCGKEIFITVSTVDNINALMASRELPRAMMRTGNRLSKMLRNTIALVWNSNYLSETLRKRWISATFKTNLLALIIASQKCLQRRKVKKKGSSSLGKLDLLQSLRHNV